MQVGRERLIFDGGTGLRALGQSLMAESPAKAHLFFSHSHWDHIQGFPFFMPAFIRGNTFKIYGVPSPNGATIKQKLHDQMLHPNFPVPLQIMRADLEFYDLEMGETLHRRNPSFKSSRRRGGLSGKLAGFIGSLYY
jgi:phosphoribosyl 1,2-cyclic phosphodiesterase